MWFLIVILNFYPEMQVVNPYNLTLFLSVIFALQVLKEGVTDWNRHRHDKMTNNIQVCKIVDGSKIETT